MLLSLKEIIAATSGAISVSENEEGVSFHRFSKNQEEFYEKVSKLQERNFHDRCLTSAGIRMMFKTDSKTLKLKGSVKKRTSRNYYCFDVFENGKPIGSIDNFSDSELPLDYTEYELPLKEFSKEFSLSDGIKEVCIFFPWSVETIIYEIALDDGAFAEPVKREKKLLAFGDSITQGYDALHPSMRYASRLCDMLGAEEFNKGIGGEFFVPDLAKITENFTPDYITVAYGTNDWSKKSEEDFKTRCKSFFKTLNSSYPQSKIFAISPIWRADYLEKKEFGLFENVEKNIKDAICGLDNVSLIHGFNLVGHDKKYFADLRLHPNDEGFRQYAENLYEQIIALTTDAEG